MLEVVKSLNNNIVLVSAQDDKEFVVFGTGIGFKKKKGDLIDISEATKVFQSEDNVKTSKMLDDISPEILSLTEKIIRFGEEKIQQDLAPSILLALADHLRFSLKRQEEEFELGENPLQWEIPHLYFGEYEIGKKALEYIKADLGIDLPPAEASFIALHFVNAQSTGQGMGETLKMTEITKMIVKIIQSMFEVVLDKTTLNYSRFITHIRYFIKRQMTEQSADVKMDDNLKEIIQERYMKSYACSLVIKETLQKKYQWQITEDELVYLTIHIERMIGENK